MSPRMNRQIVIKSLIAVFLSGAVGAYAGEEVLPRRTFRESTTYPHIFRAEIYSTERPAGYLASSGPVPMRIEQKPAAFSKRLAPPLPEAAKGVEKPLPPLSEAKAEAAPERDTRVRGKKEELPLPEPDVGKVPEDVMRFFREKDGQQGTRPYLFDPIFQTARPNELPKSKATYIKKP